MTCAALLCGVDRDESSAAPTYQSSNVSNITLAMDAAMLLDTMIFSLGRMMRDSINAPPESGFEEHLPTFQHTFKSLRWDKSRVTLSGPNLPSVTRPLDHPP